MSCVWKRSGLFSYVGLTNDACYRLLLFSATFFKLSRPSRLNDLCGEEGLKARRLRHGLNDLREARAHAGVGFGAVLAAL
jgi:hypothetical protein